METSVPTLHLLAKGEFCVTLPLLPCEGFPWTRVGLHMQIMCWLFRSTFYRKKSFKEL